MQLREVRATARNPNPPAFVGVQGSPSTEHGTKGEEQTNKIGFSNTGFIFHIIKYDHYPAW